MTARRRLFVALGTAITLATIGAGAAYAQFAYPPAGTPNLSLMVVQPTDLVPGSVLGAFGYIEPGGDFTADYAIDFVAAATPDGIRYSALDDSVEIAATPTTAAAFVGYEQHFYDSRRGRNAIARQIIAVAPERDHLKRKDIEFAGGGGLGIGEASYLDMLTVRVKRARDHEDVVLFAEGSVYASLVLTAERNEKIPQGDALELASANDAHIKAVLATGGATGASGASGTSGVTGTSS
jgi:hypothetical protein